MALRHTKEKLVLRYHVVDDGISCWAVRDRETDTLVKDAITDALSARILAEQLNDSDRDESLRHERE